MKAVTTLCGIILFYQNVLLHVVVIADCPDYSITSCTAWSDPASWSNGKIPEEGETITITSCLILDKSTWVGPLTIEPSGKLIFSPEQSSDITLKASSVLVQGTLRVGSQQCRYEGNADIILTGNPGENVNADFGEKFIGVADGGTLELHGHKKLSWSKIDQTLEKPTPETGLYFDSQDIESFITWKSGFAIFVVSPESGIVRYKDLLYTGGDNERLFKADSERLISVLDSTPPNHLIVMAAVKSVIHEKHNMTGIYEALEKAIYCRVGHSRLRHVQPFEAYVMVALKDHPHRTVEIIGRHEDKDGFRTARTHFSMPQTNMAVHVISKLNEVQSWKQVVRIMGGTYDSIVPKVTMTDDVSTWVPGDRVLITSTDYDWAYATEALVEKCPVDHRNITCGPNEVRLNFMPIHMHWGEINHKVDMRAEVALLSRNVRVQGEIPKSAGIEQATFGGQIKIKVNFENVHIEGIELKEMGQLFRKDAFPIFFDTCSNVSDDKYSTPAYIKDNSIITSFRGCVALRETHGLLVKNNVAFKHLSNCFFLMEGGEKHNVFDGNLAAGTIAPDNKISTLTELEKQKTASFLITNPHTYFTNNVAAGGEQMGIMFAFPSEPIGQSKGKDLMKRFEAQHTPLAAFSGNVAHSNFESGVDMQYSISDDEKFFWNSKYEPREDPMDKDSNDVAVYITKMTSYKNRFYNLKARGGFFYYRQCSFSDSAYGIMLMWSSNQRQYLTDSVILGESPNIGDPHVYFDGNDKKWKSMPRSIPIYWNREFPIQGITIVDGPTYYHNLWLNYFSNTPNYTLGALGFLEGHKWATSPQTSFENISWGFDDGESTGNRIYDQLPGASGDPEMTGEKQVMLRDLDGSVTGVVDSTVVKPYPMLYTNDCWLRENWNMYVCPNRYGKIKVQYGNSNDKNNILPMMTRDSLPDEPFSLDWKTAAHFPVVLGGDYSYILHFESDMPSKVTITALGVEKDLWVRIGVCLPIGANIDLYTWNPEWKPKIENWNKVDNVQSLEGTDVATSYYWDEINGFIFFKFMNNLKRNNTFPYEKEECPDDKCPFVRITVTNMDSINKDISDCKTRAYEGNAPYKRIKTSLSKVSNSVSLPTSSSEPSGNIGAGDSYPFHGAVVTKDEGYGLWSTWSQCSVECNGGVNTRQRVCQETTGCNGPSVDTKKCNTNPCSSEWMPWSTCSVTCGGGTQTRQRTCEVDPCDDIPSETRQCNKQACPINGGYSSWTQWTSCSVSCGGGKRERERTCDNPKPDNGGKECNGKSEQTKKCNKQGCPIDGGYGSWTQWNACTATCGGGSQTRARKCNDPSPQFKGKDCVGDNQQTQACNNEPCFEQCQD